MTRIRKSMTVLLMAAVLTGCSQRQSNQNQEVIEGNSPGAAGQAAKDSVVVEIGRASCRERV